MKGDICALKRCYFYPRSPCGERRFGNSCTQAVPEFLSTLSLRRATRPPSPPKARVLYFYPRSPCGERQDCNTHIEHLLIFLSTLSLRRATMWLFNPSTPTSHFYPRSPCGERQQAKTFKISALSISIHALLAESDRVKL